MNNSLYSNLYHVLNLRHEYPRDELQSDIVPWLLWRLWKCRNEFLFKGREYEARSVLRKVQEDVEEWRERKKEEASEAERVGARIPTTANQRCVWKPPPANWLKCNSDGAWNHNRVNSGLGWVLRNEKGNVLWAGAKAVTRAVSTIVTEAEALKWAVQNIVSLGYKYVIFESDSQTLVRMISGQEEVWPILQPIVEETRRLLSQVQFFQVCFYPRGGNKVADRIAKETYTFVSIVPKLYSVVSIWLKFQVMSDKTMYENSGGE